MTRHTPGEKGAFSGQLRLEECWPGDRPSLPATYRHVADVLAFEPFSFPSRRSAGFTCSMKWTVANKKWAPSDLVTSASTDFKHTN